MLNLAFNAKFSILMGKKQKNQSQMKRFDSLV